MDEAGILNELLPELNRILKFSTAKLYFLSHRLLTMQNVQDLEKTNSQADLTTKLVALLEQGTRKPAQKMVEVLSDMVKSNDGSEALEDLIEQIQLKLKSAAAAAVRTSGPVMRSRTPAEQNLLDSSGRQNRSPSSPHLPLGYQGTAANYLSSSGDSSGYHSEVSSCLSIPGQHNVWYPSQHSGNRKTAGVRLSRCYSDWTISSLRVPYFHDSYFPSPGVFFPEEGSLGFHHHPTRPHMLSNHDGSPLAGRNKSVVRASSRAHGELMSTPEEPEKDSPQLRPNSRQKNLDDLCLLVESTHKITSAYSTFTVRVASLLLQNNIDVNTILLWLSCKLSMNGPGCLSIPQNSPIFQAKSVHEVFQELQSFTSWLDYTLTASLAEELGGEEGNKLVAEYEVKLKPHLEERVAIFHPDYHNTPPVGFQEIKVKLDWDLVKTSYDRVVRFRITLSRILCAQPSSFILKGLREGCVLLTWIVPEYLCQSMLESAKINRDFLAVHAVLAISILGYTIIGKDSPQHEGEALLDSTQEKMSSSLPSQDGIHLEGNIPLPTWPQDDCSLSREPARNIGSQSSLSYSSNSICSSSYDKLQSRPESSNSDQEFVLPTQDEAEHDDDDEEAISIQSLRRSPKSDHCLLPCYSFSSTATQSAINSPQETLNSLPDCTNHQNELQSHTASAVSQSRCPIDEEKEPLFFSSSWQYDSTREGSLQHSAVFQQSDTIEEPIPKVKEEPRACESRKQKGRIGTVKRFLSLIVQSVSSRNTSSTAVEKETPAPLSHSAVAASLPNLRHHRLVSQQVEANQTRIGSIYSQADSGFASRSGSESNSIRRRSIAAISTLTSNQDCFSRQGSFTSTKEGTLSSRPNTSTASLGFPLSHEKRAIEKQKKESMSSLCDSVLKPCSTERSSVQCSKDSLFLSSFSSSVDDADDEEAELPEQRLMLMTAGCAKAYRMKPKSLQYRQEGKKQLRSRNKYSPVKTCNPFATSPDNNTKKAPPQTLSGKITRHLAPPTSRKEYVSGEFNDILDSLYELNSSFHHSRQEDMFHLSQEDTLDSDSSPTPTSTTPLSPPTPDAEMYLSAAWILQDALSNLPDFEENPRDDNTKTSQETA